MPVERGCIRTHLAQIPPNLPSIFLFSKLSSTLEFLVFSSAELTYNFVFNCYSYGLAGILQPSSESVGFVVKSPLLVT